MDDSVKVENTEIGPFLEEAKKVMKTHENTLKRLAESENKVSFDVYFKRALVKNKKIQAHHKAPMRAFAEKNDIKIATIEEFDKLFEKY